MSKWGTLIFLVASLSFAQRLPTTVTPENYDLKFTVDLANARFDGTETIRVQLNEPTAAIVLNAAEIVFHDVTIGAEKAAVTVNDRNETATLTVPRPLARGAHDIHISYSGILNNKLRGFYLSKTKTRNYAVTQFEATDARRAFPSFDEPAFKATYSITLVVDKSDTAISNGHIVSDTPGPGAGRHTIVFSPSPKMSSYLVAMAVGDFECLSGRSDNVPVRVCATPGKSQMAAIALDSAEQILKFYDNYYAIKWPWGKLDVLAIPDFAAGAMENTAAIFYREVDLLADTKGASIATRRTIASVLAHEMAHQWFGDLVTMKWWDDVWLNEGFATWMATKPLAALHPEWDMTSEETLESVRALTTDSLRATRAIHAAADTPAEIDAAFDAIAYQKGAAVLRMIESYVTPEVFRKGINDYLQKHEWSNATAPDFWAAIASASGKPVDRIMRDFVNQPGVPVLTAAAACDTEKTVTRVSLTQERFIADGSKPADPSARWQIPVCAKTAGANSCAVIGKPEDTITLPGCSSWIFLNSGARGYYRTAYSSEMLAALAPQLQTALTAPERIRLMDDEWALVRTGRQTVSDYLTLASGFGAEMSSEALTTVDTRLLTIGNYLTTENNRAKYEGFVRNLLGPLYRQVGFVTQPSDSDQRRELRSQLILALGISGRDPEVIRSARSALDASLSGGQALDPALSDAIIRVAAENGDAKLFDALSGAAEKAASPEDHNRYLYSLGFFRAPDLVDRGLQNAFALRNQDTAIYLGRFLNNPHINAQAWAFVKKNWADLEPKLTVFGGASRTAAALASFCDPASREDIQEFFKAHSLPAAARAEKQALEQINACIAYRTSQTGVLETYLQGR